MRITDCWSERWWKDRKDIEDRNNMQLKYRSKTHTQSSMKLFLSTNSFTICSPLIASGRKNSFLAGGKGMQRPSQLSKYCTCCREYDMWSHRVKIFHIASNYVAPIDDSYHITFICEINRKAIHLNWDPYCFREIHISPHGMIPSHHTTNTVHHCSTVPYRTVPYHSSFSAPTQRWIRYKALQYITLKHNALHYQSHAIRTWLYQHAANCANAGYSNTQCTSLY